MYMVTNTMFQNRVEIEHIGCMTSTNGVIGIDVKTARGIISRSDVLHLLEEEGPIPVYDAEDLIRHIGIPREIGRAWISHSGRAVMFLIHGIQYISPLSQVRKVLSGERKGANVSFIWWNSLPLDAPGAVPAEVQG